MTPTTYPSHLPTTTKHHSNMTATDTITVLGEYISPNRPNHKKWKKTWKLFSLYFTLSNSRVKLRLSNHDRSGRLQRICCEMKQYKYKMQQGTCPLCGETFPLEYMQLHHILPWSRFPDFRGTKKNHLLICKDCHKEIHSNPFLNIRLQQAMAAELQVDLAEKYRI